MPKKVLIAEDHEGNADTFRDYIKTFFPDWQITYATTGRQAIDKTLAEKPDVLILDIALGDNISGVRVVKEIAKHTKSPRIVLITALSNRATDGPRPGRPWIEQFEPDEKILIVDFYEKIGPKWGDFVASIAKAANVPIPPGSEEL